MYYTSYCYILAVTVAYTFLTHFPIHVRDSEPRFLTKFVLFDWNFLDIGAYFVHDFQRNNMNLADQSNVIFTCESVFDASFPAAGNLWETGFLIFPSVRKYTYSNIYML